MELVWDDTVAPETCVDFDAPHVSSAEVFRMILVAIAGFTGLYAYVAWTDPVGSNPVALRSTVIPMSTMQQVIGAEVTAEGAAEEGGEEEEEH